MQIIVFFFLKINVSDINAQPKLFSKAFFQDYLSINYPFDFSLDLFLLYQAKTHQHIIYTFPVLFKKRELGEAKGGGGSLKNKFNLIKRTLKYIIKLQKELKEYNLSKK